MLEQQTTIRPTTDDGANYFSSICSFMVGQMPEAAATINSATVILTRTPLMPEPKPTTTRREQTRERERSCFRSFYHQERRRRKARGKEILKNACLIFTSNSWNFKLVSRKYHVTLSNQGLVLENCMNKKPKKKKVSPSTVTKSTGLVDIISASASVLFVLSIKSTYLFCQLLCSNTILWCYGREPFSLLDGVHFLRRAARHRRRRRSKMMSLTSHRIKSHLQRRSKRERDRGARRRSAEAHACYLHFDDVR